MEPGEARHNLLVRPGAASRKYVELIHRSLLMELEGFRAILKLQTGRPSRDLLKELERQDTGVQVPAFLYTFIIVSSPRRHRNRLYWQRDFR
jgi:hypothetical protein